MWRFFRWFWHKINKQKIRETTLVTFCWIWSKNINWEAGKFKFNYEYFLIWPTITTMVQCFSMYKCNFFVSEQMQRWNILGNFLPKNKPLIGWSSRLTNQRPSFWQEIALNRYVPSMPFSKNGNFSCDLMKIHEIKLPLFRHFSNHCTTYKCIYFLIGYICQIYILWSYQEGSFFTE